MPVTTQRPRKKKPEAKVVVKGNRGVKVVKACTINRSPEELYRFWRQVENLPHFMKNVISITETSHKNSHWVVKGPMGRNVEWDAVIINEHENKLIAWRTREGARVPHAGSVRFEPSPLQGTEVTISLEYDPPAGKLGKMVAHLFGKEPGREVEEDLRRFKALMETGEIPAEAGSGKA